MRKSIGRTPNRGLDSVWKVREVFLEEVILLLSPE